MKKLIYLLAVILFVGCEREREDDFEEVTILMDGFLLIEKEVDLPITSNNLPYTLKPMFFYINPVGDTVKSNSYRTVKVPKGTETIKIDISPKTNSNFVIFVIGVVEENEKINLKSYPGFHLDTYLPYTTIEIFGKHTKYRQEYDAELNENILVDDGIFEQYEAEIPVKHLRYKKKFD